MDDLDARAWPTAQARRQQTCTICGKRILEEIAADIDALIEASSDPDTTAQLQAIRDKAAVVAAEGEAQGATLQALAAKYEQPLPPPVEPTPDV